MDELCSADSRLEEHRDALLVISYNGLILWMPQAIYRSSCEINVSSFPFDVQTCELKFGSWTYDGYKMDLQILVDEDKDPDKIDLSEYVESNSWKIIKAPAKKRVQHYTCCPEPFVDLAFTLVFQRRATFYNYILILPCILLTSITLVLFWIPPESPAKLMLGESPSLLIHWILFESIAVYVPWVSHLLYWATGSFLNLQQYTCLG